MPPPSDQRLLDDYRATRSEQAIAELMDRHGAMVLATCERVAGNRHDAEEAAQVVFLILVRKVETLGSVGCLAAWLHRTARFVALRARTARVRRSRREAPLTAGAAPAVEGGGLAMAGSGDDDLRGRLDAALDRLPAIYRESLVLHYVEGLDCEKIAGATGVTAEAVAMRLSRGRELLRRRLRRPPTDSFDRSLAGITAMHPIHLSPEALRQPTPMVQSLMRDCLLAAKSAAIATATAWLVAVTALAIGTVLITQRLPATEPQPEPPPASTTTVDSRMQVMGVPICEPWEERLQMHLLRAVTLHARDVGVVSVLRRIGDTCNLPMVIDLAPDHAPLGHVTVVADASPLGDVLDMIAAQAGIGYAMRDGALWWSDHAVPRGCGSSVIWVFEVRPFLAQSDSPEPLIDEIRNTAGVDWGHGGAGIDLHCTSALVVSHQPVSQMQVERALHRRLAGIRAASNAAAVAAARQLGVAFGDMPVAERRMRAALTATIPQAIEGKAVQEILDAVTQATGVRIVATDGIDLGRPWPQRMDGIHLQGLEARHALAIALGSFGWRAELRPGAGRPGDDVVAVTVASAPLVKRHYALTDVRHAIIAAGSFLETQDIIDLIKLTVAPASWSADGVRLEESGGDIDVVQTATVQAGIEAAIPLIARVFTSGDAASRTPVPPAATIEIPSSGEF